jgi:CheY-like chemotaxis protein
MTRRAEASPKPAHSPGRSGVTLAVRLEGTLIAALSGYGSADDQQKSQATGFDRHLVKPIDRATLEHLVESAAARK